MGKKDVGVSQEQLTRQICEIGCRMYDKGFVAGNDGNISCRLDEGRYLCTPADVSKGFMEPADIAVVDDEGNQLTGRLEPTSEVPLHLRIYHELPRINAVAHAHPPHATAFAVAGISPPVGVMPEAEIYLGPIPLADYGTPGGPELADTILPHLRNKAGTILLANHGAVACGKDLMQAYWRLERLEMYCRILILSKQLGSVRPLPEAKVRQLLQYKKNRYGMDEDDPRMD